jgi:hypothetical protein
MGKLHGLIVGGIGGIVAPAIIGLDRRKGEGGRRRGEAVGPVKNAPERPAAGGRRAIPFTFDDGDAAFAQGTAKSLAGAVYRPDDGARQSGNDQLLAGD